MKIRLYNALLLTMEEGREPFTGEVHVVEDKIIYVGDGKAVEQVMGHITGDASAWDKEIDCRGNLLLPGFKNAHTHSGMTFLRSYADDLPLQAWLHKKVFPAEARLIEEDIYHLAKLAVLEYLTSGITSIFDMYVNPDATANACMDMGMNCVLVSGLNNFTSSLEQVAAEYQKWNHSSPLIEYRLGFHAEYTCSRELLTQLSTLAHNLQAPVYTHLSETVAEVEECRERYGLTPPMFLDSLGMFDYGGGGYHCIHTTEEDKVMFQRRGFYVVTNPASNLKLASGIAPLNQYLKMGIPIAIGTDGPASNNCLDMFREMFLVTGLSKLREKDAACMDALDVLKMAVVNGAHAMGLGDADMLMPGKMADIIMIDLHQPNMHPLHHVGKNLVYSGSKQNVVMTMVHGRILYQDGNFYVGEDIDTIYRKVEETTKRLLTL